MVVLDGDFVAEMNPKERVLKVLYQRNDDKEEANAEAHG